MTDRELLELAARAAGLSGWIYEPSVNGMVLLDSSRQIGTPYWLSYASVFRPLTDDGDALRLAVELGMNVYTSAGVVRAEVIHDGDIPSTVSKVEWGKRIGVARLEATRLAITRAAAEIGRGM